MQLINFYAYIGLGVIFALGFMVSLFIIIAPFRYFWRAYKFTLFLLEAETKYPGRILNPGFLNIPFAKIRLFFWVLRNKGFELFWTMADSPIEYHYYNCKYSIHRGAQYGN